MPPHRTNAVTLNSGTLTIAAPTAPTISSIAHSPGNSDVTIAWSAVSNCVYRVQYTTNLAGANWLSLTPDVTATGETASFTDHPGSAPQRFYRVVLVTAQAPTTLSIKGNSDGTAAVACAGTPGARYVLQIAANLTPPVTWMNLATNTAGTDGRWTVTDSTTNRTQRFFRVVPLP